MESRVCLHPKQAGLHRRIASCIHMPYGSFMYHDNDTWISSRDMVYISQTPWGKIQKLNGRVAASHNNVVLILWSFLPCFLAENCALRSNTLFGSSRDERFSFGACTPVSQHTQPVSRIVVVVQKQVNRPQTAFAWKLIPRGHRHPLPSLIRRKRQELLVLVRFLID